ncbi:carbohydrate ABC transporter permease [Lacticaseibacillus mingshuiensis]|uniref:Carbohydrate ABC transporter permease n=1 Tax=Lacticaseibacillus mingshuiensis TaxID=2799574 RepID=A0ABW4CJS6_9LACO|nr:carbohydrate ABC transporter permease [Lacticaseibacillus mingshuiensis]
MTSKKAAPKQSRVKHGSRTFNIINATILLIFTVIIIVPMWNILISSFATSDALSNGNFIFWPKSLSLDNYRAVFQDSGIWQSFFISVLKTAVGVVAHTLFCAIVAYPLSKRYLKGRKLYSAMGIVTMFFSGGMIPTYLLIKSLGLLDSFWVYIIPALFSYYDVVILMNFFRQVPESLEESARIDGASDWRVFFSIILPLSKPSLATIALFHGVWQWNDFMTTKLYVTNESLYPLQMRLYNLIVQSQAASTTGLKAAVAINTTSRGVQLATIMITIVPILILYPFVQRYFVSGTMLGAVKE